MSNKNKIVLEKTGAAFTSRGMHVNDSVGKTEDLVRFDGTGAGKVRAQIKFGFQTISALSPMFGQLDIRGNRPVQASGVHQCRAS